MRRVRHPGELGQARYALSYRLLVFYFGRGTFWKLDLKP